MKIRRNKRNSYDIAVIPMIDVFMVLLIFFMITTTFNKLSALSIKLPQANSIHAENSHDNITLSIDEKGSYYLTGTDGQTKKLVDQQSETLILELNKLDPKAKAMPFIIQADANSNAQAVMTVLDVAGQLGFNQLSIAAVGNELKN